MDEKRARDIASSPRMVDVTYNGDLVYIEHVNEGAGTASIHTLIQPAGSQEVPLASLREQ